MAEVAQLQTQAREEEQQASEAAEAAAQQQEEVSATISQLRSELQDARQASAQENERAEEQERAAQSASARAKAAEDRAAALATELAVGQPKAKSPPAAALPVGSPKKAALSKLNGHSPKRSASVKPGMRRSATLAALESRKKPPPEEEPVTDWVPQAVVSAETIRAEATAAEAVAQAKAGEAVAKSRAVEEAAGETVARAKRDELCEAESAIKWQVETRCEMTELTRVRQQLLVTQHCETTALEHLNAELEAAQTRADRLADQRKSDSQEMSSIMLQMEHQAAASEGEWGQRVQQCVEEHSELRVQLFNAEELVEPMQSLRDELVGARGTAAALEASVGDLRAELRNAKHSETMALCSAEAVHTELRRQLSSDADDGLSVARLRDELRQATRNEAAALDEARVASSNSELVSELRQQLTAAQQASVRAVAEQQEVLEKRHVGLSELLDARKELMAYRRHENDMARVWGAQESYMQEEQAKMLAAVRAAKDSLPDSPDSEQLVAHLRAELSEARSATVAGAGADADRRASDLGSEPVLSDFGAALSSMSKILEGRLQKHRS
mmetsp:Transcript_52540/g.119667  ORF Transcript_52540/g.119667 Transcript_52540/m.119667 type:complete len:561 (-) Transcript_52540:26-1708(-)